MKTRSQNKKPRSYDPLKPRLDVHDAITAKIVAAIEAGAGEFQMPWHRPGVSFTIPTNALTRKPYRGSNILSLWIDADEKKFERQIWATFKQWLDLGAQVRKGEKGSLIVKYGEWTPKDDSPGGRPASDCADETDTGKRLFAKAAYVFNADQVDGFAAAPQTERRDLTQRLFHVDAFVAATGAQFREGGQLAYYRHRNSKGEGDYIQIPDRHLFIGTTTSTPTEAYESTRLHELGHWTGAAHRLNRESPKRYGDAAYAFEELVAELAAAYLCAGLEITNAPRADHAQYIANWLNVLKGDSKAIFSAASLATRAVDYLYALQPTPAPDAPEVQTAARQAPARPDSATASRHDGEPVGASRS